MKIVTKKGDDGTTGTLHGTRISKSSDQMEYMGTLDELQSFLGLIEDNEDIKEIQDDLYRIMCGELLGPGYIDLLISKLTIPDLENIVIPSGPIHVARAVCRRAERRAVQVQSENTAYLNRLGDYLFILNFNL